MKARDHELHSRHYPIVHCTYSIGTDVRDYHNFNDIGYIVNFIKEVDSNIVETKNTPFMDLSLQATSPRWWVTHHNQFQGWESIKIAMLC